MKRLNKKDKKLRSEKWANWIRDVKGDILYDGFLEWMSMRRRGKQVYNPERFLVMFELRDVFDKARIEVNQKDYNRMYHELDSFLFDPTIPRKKVEVLHYQELIDVCEKYQTNFVSYKIPAYIAEFKKLM